MRRVIRSAAIVSMDDGIGTLPQGDILIEDDRIVDVAPSIDVDDAEEIDARHMIAIPGLVNAHNHLWHTILRGVGGDFVGSDYYKYLQGGLAPLYTPEDLHVALRFGALAQIDGAMPRLNSRPSGCAFHPRCPQAGPRCLREKPQLVPAARSEAACFIQDGGTE